MNRSAFEQDFIRTLPDSLRNAACFAFNGKATAEEKSLARRIEIFRSEIASRDEEYSSFSSPHSGTFRIEEGDRATVGPLTKNPAAAHAKTGASLKSGILLRRIVTGLDSRRILELGTNTGLSACYFLSAAHKPEVVTIEGSTSLCAIADRNLRRVSDNFTIMNTLFDDALSELAVRDEKFDCAFIDGQHEREATWHYTRKLMPLLNPGGAIIFDDIYWSEDMNQFWKEACFTSEFSLTVDFGSKGVALLRQGEERHMHYDICEYAGRPRIYRKGW